MSSPVINPLYVTSTQSSDYYKTLCTSPHVQTYLSLTGYLAPHGPHGRIVMQSARGRTSSPRPLTRRSSKRGIPSTPSKSKSSSPFQVPPVSPTTPTNICSPFTNPHSPAPASLTLSNTQSSAPSPSPTPPPTPASSPTASRQVRHLSFRRRQSEPYRKISELTRKQSDLTRKTSELTRKQSNVTRRRIQIQSPDKCSTTPPPKSPRKVRFVGERVEYLPGDSSGEEEDYPDPVLESHAKATAPRAKDQKDSRRCTRQNLGRDSSTGRIAENDHGASRRGRSSTRGPSGKRSATPFVRRGSNLDYDEEDEDKENEAKESRVIRGSSGDTDVSALTRESRYKERDDLSTSRRGRSSSRGAPAKRSSTPFVRRNVNWDDDDDDEEQEEEEDDPDNGEEGRVFVHVTGAEPNSDESIVRKRSSARETDDGPTSGIRGRSSSRGARAKRSATPFVRRCDNWEDEDEDENDGEDDEPGSSRRGRSSSRGAPAKRSATPFARRNLNWEDEDGDDEVEGPKPARENRSDSKVEGNSESEDEGHVRWGRSIGENDDGLLSTRRGRNSNRGARAKHSATSFMRRDICMADEDKDDDENDADQGKGEGKENAVVHTSNEAGDNGGDDSEKSLRSIRRGRSMHDDRASNAERGRSSSRGAAAKHSATPFVRRSVNWEDEVMETVERVGLAVIEETEDCATIVEDENQQSHEQNHTHAVRKNGADGSESRVDTLHLVTVAENGNLQVTVACSCGKRQTLTYNSLTGIEIKPC